MITPRQRHLPPIPKPKGQVVFGYDKAIFGDESRDVVTIYGDPDGLRWLANVLIAIADTDQRCISDDNLPPDEGFHTDLRPGIDCHVASKHGIVGRLDAKLSGSTAWFLETIS
jgi:hypothetical protein